MGGRDRLGMGRCGLGSWVPVSDMVMYRKGINSLDAVVSVVVEALNLVVLHKTRHGIFLVKSKNQNQPRTS